MDENSTVSELEKLYKLENRSVMLETKEDYVQKHIGRIFNESVGGWNRTVADKYIKTLKQTI